MHGWTHKIPSGQCFGPDTYVTFSSLVPKLGCWICISIPDRTTIPTCIGISQHKSLTKLATHIYETAERKLGSYPAEATQGRCLVPAQDLDDVSQPTDVSDVWGRGQAYLQSDQGPRNSDCAGPCRNAPSHHPPWLREHEVDETVRQLQAQYCVDLDDVLESKQQIANTLFFE